VTTEEKLIDLLSDTIAHHAKCRRIYVTTDLAKRRDILHLIANDLSAQLDITEKVPAVEYTAHTWPNTTFDTETTLAQLIIEKTKTYGLRWQRCSAPNVIAKCYYAGSCIMTGNICTSINDRCVIENKILLNLINTEVTEQIKRSESSDVGDLRIEWINKLR